MPWLAPTTTITLSGAYMGATSAVVQMSVYEDTFGSIVCTEASGTCTRAGDITGSVSAGDAMVFSTTGTAYLAGVVAYSAPDTTITLHDTAGAPANYDAATVTDVDAAFGEFVKSKTALQIGRAHV